jgi:[ribosomal protein S18]-alanine N-acetyltransferase
MSAVPRDHALVRSVRAMDTRALDEVLRIEQQCYPYPWSRGNFIDSLAAGHWAKCLFDERGAMLGYCVAMAGVDEVHLLNLTIAPDHQRAGHARFLLDALCEQGRTGGAHLLWLEVRPSNQRARALYERYGFEAVGLRRGYYPDAGGRREDAIVMRFALAHDDGTP